MILLHLGCALLSIIVTTLAVFMPSKAKLLVAKALAASTLVTGTILVFATH